MSALQENRDNNLMTLISLKTELFLDYDFGPLLGVEDSSTFPSDFSLHLDVDICLYTCTEKYVFASGISST